LNRLCIASEQRNADASRPAVIFKYLQFHGYWVLRHLGVNIETGNARGFKLKPIKTSEEYSIALDSLNACSRGLFAERPKESLWFDL
jgi:hypothetical protein